MQVHRDIDHLPAFRNAVITIGTFDGVHTGHRKIIETIREAAKAVKGETVIITFHPHPRKIVSSAILGVRLITTLDERIRLLHECGVDHLVVVPFTEAFANQPAESYVRDFLVEKFRPRVVTIGYDHRFGKDRQGDYKLLENLAPVYGFELREIPQYVLDEITISSTKIREAILHADIQTANRYLGYEFFFSGEVIHGNKLGRELGYPTANLKMENEEKIIPGDGIYAVYADLGEQSFKGMMSIGFRPTVDGKKRVIEVNLFDFDREIYGQTIRVRVKQYLRPEKKFENLRELTDQIGRDKVASLSVL